jgi:glycosyltransferase involved in cell wall biosynthesis
MGNLMEKKQKIRLAIIHPSPYPVKLPLFDIVCAQTDSIVLFSSKDSVDHPEWNVDEVLKQFNFKYKFLPGFRIKRMDVRPSVFWYLLRYKPDVVVTTEFNLQTIFSYAYARLFNSRILIQSNATTNTDAIFTKRKSLREWLIKHCDGFIANSSETKKYLCALGANPQKITISVQTIDVNKWKIAVSKYKHLRNELKNELGLREKVILYVGNLHQGKGVNFLLEAFSNVAQTLADTNILIVGGGSEEQRLRDYCKQKGIMERVIFAGYKQSWELPKYYALADLFVFPTLYDHFGLVVIEALASGLPVICSQFAGSALDLIKDGVNGYIIDPRNIENLSDSLVNILADESLLQKLKQGVIDLAGNFTVEKSAENFLDAIDSVMVSNSS